jgi:hypothetical protein
LDKKRNQKELEAEAQAQAAALEKAQKEANDALKEQERLVSDFTSQIEYQESRLLSDDAETRDDAQE